MKQLFYLFVYCSWRNEIYICCLSSRYAVVNFQFQLIFIFPLFLGMVMCANEFKTKEKQKLTATDLPL